MARLALKQEAQIEPGVSRWIYLYPAAALAAFVQLLCIVTTLVVVTTLGAEPVTAAENFAVLHANRLVGILRMDLASVANVALFSVASFGIYAAIKTQQSVYAAFATALIFVGIAVSMASNPALSMIYLSDQYEVAVDAAQRSQLLAAGEAVIATGWWHSSAGLMAGIFLQGGMVLLSLLMLRSTLFGSLTAYAGMLANGLDLIHVLVGLVLPGLGNVLLAVGGLFYLLWYPLLGRDFYRLARKTASEKRPL